jgi:hypothetical protein
MAGPFPGMDPYLENPVLWPGAHQGLISGLRNVLNRLLPPGYVADMGERIYVMQPDRSIYPDVVVFEQSPPTPLPAASGASAAVADPPLILIDEPVEVREVYIEILPVGDETRVITVIEVLSLVNKARNTEGNNLYRAKQRELLHSRVNLVEIDLLRRGEHTAAISQEALRRHRQNWDYLVCLHRSGERDRYWTWPFTLRDRLPRFSVPLEGELPDVIVDLQEVFDRNYEDAAYARRLDYARDPVPLLAPADAAWAETLLRAAGYRQSKQGSGEAGAEIQ